jgi:Glycosyltransferase family 87
LSSPRGTATGTGFPARRLAFTILACLVLAGAAIALRLPVMNLGDFSSHAAAVQRALHGDPVYTAVQLAGPYHLPDISRGRGFVYPPTAVLLLLPSALGSIWAVLMLVGSLGLLAFVTTEIVRVELPRRAWIGWPLAALLLVSPIAGDAIDAGQVTPLLAAGYGAAWLWPRVSGYVAIVGAAVKIYPLVLLAWAVRNRADLRLPLVMGVVLVIAATAWLGAGVWLDFWTAWQNALPQCTPPSLGSLACSFGRTGELMAIGLAVVLTLLATRVPGPAVAFLLLAIASVIAAPDLFPNYLLVVTVGALPLACRLASGAGSSEPASSG